MYGQSRTRQAQARMQKEILSTTKQHNSAHSQTRTPFCCHNSRSLIVCVVCCPCVGEFCLLRCHGIDVVRMAADERDRWVCPACHSLCYCAACQRYEKHRAAERATLHSTVIAASVVRDVTHPASSHSHSQPHTCPARPYQSLRVDTSPSSNRAGTASFHSSPLTPLATLDYHSLPSTPTAAITPPLAPVPPPRPSHALIALARSTPHRPPPLHLPIHSPASTAAAAQPLFSPVGMSTDSGSSASSGERVGSVVSPFVPLLISRSSPHPFFTFPIGFGAPQLFSAPPHCSSSRTYSWSEIQG